MAHDSGEGQQGRAGRSTSSGSNSGVGNGVMSQTSTGTTGATAAPVATTGEATIAAVPAVPAANESALQQALHGESHALSEGEPQMSAMLDASQRMANVRRRRSSAQSQRPRQRRRIHRLADTLRFWNRDGESIQSLFDTMIDEARADMDSNATDNNNVRIATGASAAVPAPSGNNDALPRSPSGDASGREDEIAHFMDELDSIASRLGNTAAARATQNRSLSGSADSNDSGTTQGSLSFDNQVEMLSRLLELAASSALRGLMGSSVVNGRRFDNTSRSTGDNGAPQDSTYQEFVTQLHHGLLNTELTRNAGSDNMSFFRAFRFDSETSQGANGNQTANEHSVVPVMIIGLRSVQQPRDTTATTSNSTPQPENVDWFMRGENSRPPTTSANPTASHPTSPTLSPSSSETTTRSTSTPQDEDSAAHTSWVIFVMGNSFEWNHPLLSAPSLMSENPTYEDLLNLQDLIGQVKPQVTTAEELEKHDCQLFEIVSTESSSLRTTQYKTLDHTALNDRCQICLSDYQCNEIVRKLPNCGHFYHQTCIDTWLTRGKNNCPLCRSKGIQSQDDTTAS